MGVATLLAASSALVAVPAMAADQGVTNFGIGDSTLVNGVYELHCMQEGRFMNDVYASFTAQSYLLNTDFIVTNNTTGADPVRLYIGTQSENHSVHLVQSLLPARGDFDTVANLTIKHESRAIEKTFNVKRQRGITVQAIDHPQDPAGFWRVRATNHSSAPIDIKYASSESALTTSASYQLIPAKGSVELGGYNKTNRDTNTIYYTSGLNFPSGFPGNECDSGSATLDRSTTSTTQLDKEEYHYGEKLSLTGTVAPARASGTYEFPIRAVGGTTAVQTPTASLSSGTARTSVQTPDVGDYSVAGGYRRGSIYDASSAAASTFSVQPETVTFAQPAVTINPTTRTLSATVVPDHGTLPVSEGTVEVRDGDTLLGTGTLVDGAVAITLTDLPRTSSGTLALAYSGSGNYLPATGTANYAMTGFGAGTFAVTAPWLLGGDNVVEYGNTVTAGIGATDDAGAPASGNVEVAGFGSIGTQCLLDAAGTCSIARAPAVGSYTLVPRGTDAAAPIVFAPASLGFEVMKARATLDTAAIVNLGHGTHDIRVTANNGLTIPNDGSVSVSDADGEIAVLPVSNGVAVLDLTSLPAGTSDLTFSYVGSASYVSEPLTRTRSEKSYALQMSLDRQLLGGAPVYAMGESATVGVTIDSNVADLSGYTVQFTRDGHDIGLPQPIDATTRAASLVDDFASITSTPLMPEYSAVLLGQGSAAAPAATPIALSLTGAPTTLTGSVQIAGSTATLSLTASSPFAGTAPFGGSALVTLGDSSTYPVTLVPDAGSALRQQGNALFSLTQARAFGSVELSGLPVGTVEANAVFTPNSPLYAGALTGPIRFDIAGGGDGGDGDGGSGGGDGDGGDGGSGDGGGGSGGGDGDGGDGGSGDGGGGSGGGDTDGAGAGTGGLALTGTPFAVPLAGAGIVTALGMLALLAAAYRSRAALGR